MKGYLYKELKQNRLFLSLTALLAVCVALLPIVLIMISEKTTGRETFFVFAQSGIVLRLLISLAGCIGTYALLSFTLKGDDRKMWGYFVASSPKGIKGFLFTKYGFILALSVIYLSLCAGCDLVLVLFTKYIAGVPVMYMTKIYLALFFCQIFSCAVDIPFTIRFGEKRGSYIKTAMLTVLMIILMLVFLVHPDRTSNVMDQFLSDEETPALMKWILPGVSLIAYILSYPISCRLYLKGVEEYYQ